MLCEYRKVVSVQAAKNRPSALPNALTRCTERVADQMIRKLLTNQIPHSDNTGLAPFIRSRLKAEDAAPHVKNDMPVRLKNALLLLNPAIDFSTGPEAAEFHEEVKACMLHRTARPKLLFGSDAKKNSRYCELVNKIVGGLKLRKRCVESMTSSVPTVLVEYPTGNTQILRFISGQNLLSTHRRSHSAVGG